MYQLSCQFTILSSFPLSEPRAGSEQILDFVWPFAGLPFPTLPGFVVRIADHCIGSINSCKERLGYLARAENGGFWSYSGCAN